MLVKGAPGLVEKYMSCPSDTLIYNKIIMHAYAHISHIAAFCVVVRFMSIYPYALDIFNDTGAIMKSP